MATLKEGLGESCQKGIDEQTGEIVAGVVTTNDVKNSQVFKDLLDQVEEPIHQVSGDGAIECFECYEQALERDAAVAIPLRADAVIGEESDKHPEIAARNQTVKEVQEKGSQVWKQKTSYHRRQLAETAMFRIKTLFGDHLKSRRFESQAVESFVRGKVLNRITALGMPDYFPG